jgi:fermentation-respiration switch protein FrsA (DUF1100 family)
MKKKTPENYPVLDLPQITSVLFHPRPELPASEGRQSSHGRTEDVLIPVDKDVRLGARFHLTALEKAANLLFFHGNGEIVADYDDIGALYNQLGINLLAVDYRGYGRSGGLPSVSSMMQDCHVVLDFVHRQLHQRGLSGVLISMGRSLGSAPAIELAAAHPEHLGGLIVESGFAAAGPLLRLLGIDPDRFGFNESNGFRNLDKIARIENPTLIIHAERDHIIPFADGEALFAACASPRKTFLKIAAANHNDIFFKGLHEYLASIKTFTDQFQA